MNGLIGSNMKIGPKLVLFFLIVGLTPFLVIGGLSLKNASDALEKQAFNQLVGIREIKKKQIENFFSVRQGDMGVLMETVSTLRSEALRKLTAIRQTKKNSIEDYFHTLENQVITLSEDRMVVDATIKLKRMFKSYRDELAIYGDEIETKRKELSEYYTGQFAPTYAQQNDGKAVDMTETVAKLSKNAVVMQHAYIAKNANPLGEKNKFKQAEDGSSYSAVHGQIHPSMNHFLESFGYYDIFFVDAESGDIIYSVFKELDFGTSLLNGPWADTGLAEAYKKGLELEDQQAVFIDYKLYRPSYDAPAGFIASPIFEDGEKIGVLIFQAPLDRISTIMSERAGLGKTGETYLIGPDLLMRSNSYLDPKNRSVTSSIRHPEKGKVDTEAGRDVIAGKTDAKVINGYTGNPVLSAYTPVKVGNLQWGVLAEIDIAEAFVPTDDKGVAFYKKYIDQYGYYDLFVMNPDGYVFYSATKEADYQTNMVDGKYANSGLGKLTREVLKTKKFGIADFAAYAPSKGDPAAFIAQPVVNDGKVDVVVALQLSLKAINAMMQQREGMGETGEAYLVGQDKLMRSDSFLDPEGHTVKASFADPEKGKVDTEGTRLALAGEAGEKIFLDYNGNPVLSAFTPIKVGNTSWALMAEIGESEAFAATNNLTTLILVIGSIGAAMIAAAGYMIAKSLSGPITVMTDSMGVLAAGDKSVEIPGVGRSDEIGNMASAVQVFKDNMIKAEQLAAEQEKEQAVKEKRARVVDELLSKFNDEVDEALNVVASAATEMQSSSQSMQTTADSTAQRAGAAAAATEQASANVHSVATATEELTSSVAEINRQVTDSERIGREAKQQADRTNELVNGLSESVGKIGEVVNLINDIAEQTNLLALNATIEAARAGDAGKGFAVVASEVKNLATQTGKATDEIASQISGIQTETSDAVTAIKNITEVIDQISEISSTIASALEEQSAATGEISRNVQEAATGTSEVAENVTEVNDAAIETGNASSEVASAASEVAERAETLRKQVNSFLENVRMA